MQRKPIFKHPVIFLLLFVSACLLLYIIIVPWSHGPGLRTPAKLFINGQLSQNNNILIYQRGKQYCVDLPLLEVIEALGNQVSVEENDSVIIEIDNEIYLLSDNMLYLNDGSLLCEVPGYDAALFDRKSADGELYLEHVQLIQVLAQVGISPVDITIDTRSKTVSLNY